MMPVRSCLALLVFWVTVPVWAAPPRLVPGPVVHAEAFYPEGPQLLADGSLLVAEMPKDRVVRISGTAVSVAFHQPGCGPTSVKALPTGGFWILCHLGHRVVRTDASFRPLATITHSAAKRRIVWPNDASVDSQGNLYLSSAGRFSLPAAAEGAVVRIDAQSLQAVDLAEGIRYSNGVLCQESKKRLLVSEHLNRRVLAFDLGPRGELSQWRVFFDFANAPPVKDGYALSGPDGIAQFRDGSVLVADYGNGRVLHLSDSGKLLGVTAVPYRFVTNMAITADQRSVYVVMTEDNVTPPQHGQVQRFEVRP